MTIEKSSKDEHILKHNPRFVIVTDFETILAKDLKTKLNRDFKIVELPKYFDFFLPLTGAEIYKSTNDNKADRDAAYMLGKLYETLVVDNPDYKDESHNLNLFLSRLLFCFFSEDTGIFKKIGLFTRLVLNGPFSFYRAWQGKIRGGRLRLGLTRRWLTPPGSI